MDRFIGWGNESRFYRSLDKTSYSNVDFVGLMVKSLGGLLIIIELFPLTVISTNMVADPC